MWQRNLRSRIIRLVFVLFIALLISVSSRANVSEEFSYENIFGSDSGGGEQLSTDNLLAPFIVLGLNAGEIFVNIRPDLSIASIEKETFLKNTKTYLKPSIYKQFEATTTDYLVLEDMPKGISIIMDENLSVSLDLTPEVMSDISPEIYMDKPVLRDSKRTKAQSLISDITLKYDDEEFAAGIDQRLRMGNFYGFARNNIGVESELFADYYAGYEAQAYDILVGNIRPRSFAGVYAESNLGVALTNSLLRGSVVLESNPRYININHPSIVKIYINDVLAETKEYKPGRHRLNIPLNVTKSNIKVEITDKYGREEVIDFNFAGRYAHKIPSSEQMLYFLGVGQHTLTKDLELYAGVELGVDTLSKIQLASLVSSEIQLIGGQYFIAREFGNNESYLTLSNQESFGFNLKNYTNIYWEEFSLSVNLEYAQDYVYNTVIEPSNDMIIGVGGRYRFSKATSIRAGIEQNFNTNELEYNLRGAYTLNNNTVLRASYDYTGEEQNIQLGAEYRFSKDGDTSAYYSNEKFSTNTRYWLDNNEFTLNTFDTNQDLSITNYHDIFQSRVVLTNTPEENYYSARTQFALVATPEGIDISETIGKSAFVMLQTDEDFIGKMNVEFSDKSCELIADTNCTFKLSGGRDNYFAYKLDDMPLNVQVSPTTEVPFFAANGSGKTRKIFTKEAFFVSGTLTVDGKKVNLLIAEIIDEAGTAEEIFTDEEGGFFAELLEGTYTLKMDDMVSKPFTIEATKAVDGLIDIGTIALP